MVVACFANPLGPTFAVNVFALELLVFGGGSDSQTKPFQPINLMVFGVTAPSCAALSAN